MQDWQASRPFVDHYVLERNNAPPVLVDEINWWPLVLLPKCRNIMVNEAFLAGPNTQYLDICSGIKDKYSQIDPPTYAFIDQDFARKLEAKASPSASLNHDLKSSILDWGLSDATLAVGPLHSLLVEAIQQLLIKSAEFGDSGPYRRKTQQSTEKPEYIFVSHSLGSYLIFSALSGNLVSAGAAAALPEMNSQDSVQYRGTVFSYILQHTLQAYFFANQVALLEFASLGNTGAADASGNLFQNWIQLRKDGSQSRPQVVAWSDPSDLLSWWVPQIEGVSVQNIPIKNASHWFGLIERPLAAHDNYAKNKCVLRAIFKQF